MKTMTFTSILVIIILGCLALPGCTQAPNADEARAIAKEAYIYGFPVVDSYRIMYAYYVDPANPEYKTTFNTLRSFSRVYTPEDKAVQTPNSDTPYGFLGMDLRAEPLVITIPPMEKERYYSVQLIDAYTFNFDYIGSRTMGSKGGNFLVAGPSWEGEIPEGITKVFRCETELGFGLYRTQLINPSDIDNVKKIQEGYKVETLSAFLGQPAPKPAPAIEFVKPLTPADQKSSPEFFNILNFVLTFCPTHSSEQELMARFAKLGIGAGKQFDISTFSPEIQQAIKDGMADAWKELNEFVKTEMETGRVTSGDTFGTREYLKNNYLYRFAAAVIGIYGNSKQEAIYPLYRVDASGQPFDGSEHRYTLRFAPDQLPPVIAFWSLTMYELPSSLLSANRLNRYLINSSMLPSLARDADGGITLYLQHDSPGKAKEDNWLPAPKGPFWVAMRLYWPKQEALDGSWKAPGIQRVQ